MKTLHKVRSKKELVEIYLSQLPEKSIRDYIGNIIAQNRPKSHNCKSITQKELLTFIKLYGMPEGYILSDELKHRLKIAQNLLSLHKNK